MTTGTIKRIVRDRGFGFIQADGAAEEVFFHKSAVEQPAFEELNEGQQVTFDGEKDPGKPDRMRAAHVKLAS
jgi:CspA family cold shock protein